MTNWQVKQVTPEGWAKTSRSSATQLRHSTDHNRQSRGYGIYGQIIRTMSIWRVA